MQLIGYKKIEADILRSFTNNKLHHALIFSGIRGIGKFSFIEYLSKKITNNNQDTINNPNILFITQGLNQKKELKKDITVDEIRKINNFINLTASDSSNRVIIIDSIDYLNKNASNALLKNLEEPPQNCFFFLLDHCEAKIIDTILSRCNLIKIDSPTYKDFSTIISTHTLKLLDNEISLLFEISNGSIALALELYQNNIFQNYENIIHHLITPKKDLNSIKFTEEYFKKNNDLDQIEYILNLFFNRVAKAAKSSLSNEFFSDEKLLLREYLNHNNLKNIFKKYDQVREIFLKTDNLNLDKKHSLINIFNIL